MPAIPLRKIFLAFPHYHLSCKESPKILFSSKSIRRAKCQVLNSVCLSVSLSLCLYKSYLAVTFHSLSFKGDSMETPERFALICLGKYVMARLLKIRSKIREKTLWHVFWRYALEFVRIRYGTFSQDTF